MSLVIVESMNCTARSLLSCFTSAHGPSSYEAWNLDMSLLINTPIVTQNREFHLKGRVRHQNAQFPYEFHQSHNSQESQEP